MSPELGRILLIIGVVLVVVGGLAALGVRPGPVVGRAYRHLLQLRLDAGPVGEQAAREELLHWWADQPESSQT